MIRKLLTCCLLAIFFSTSVVGNLAWAQSLPAEVVITSKRLNVRDDVGGTKLGAVLRGQQFQLKGTKENWGKIEFEPGRLGWISLQYTKQIVAQRSVSQQRAIRPVSLKLPAGEKVELYKGSYALVIGASNYQDNAWGDLSSVGEDVKAVRQALEGQGFQVQTVMDPTEDDLINEINDFIDAHGYERDNRLLFYYSGHGYTQERNGRKFGYLVPVDAPNPYDNERDFFRKSLKMEQILSWAKQIESKHAMFVFDSCFSGSVLQSRAVAVPEDISYSTAKPVRQFLSAGSANQTVPADSIFRPLFIRGIEGKADLDQDGYVTGVELGMFLQKQVPLYQTGQTPQYGKILDPYLDEGNFVFEVGNRRRPPTTKIEPVVAAPSTPNTLDLGDLEELAAEEERKRREQQQIKTRWANWQQQMQSDYEKVTAFEQRKISNDLKIDSWQLFLKNWNDDNPYSQQDGELRSMAESRVVHWQQAPQEMTLYFDLDAFTSSSALSKSENWKTTRTSDEDFVYVGDVQDGLPNGQGTLTSPDGRKYVGEFKDGLPNGQGTQTWPSGQKYVGEYRDGEQHGQGTQTWPSGQKYVGEYRDGEQHGQGTWTHPNGEKHVGEYRDGLPNGQGTFTFPDGQKYVGEFKDDKYNGQGTLTFPDGDVWSGLWKDHEFLGRK